MNGMGYLAIGYGLVWLLLALYLIWLGQRQNSIRRRLTELEAEQRKSEE